MGFNLEFSAQNGVEQASLEFDLATPCPPNEARLAHWLSFSLPQADIDRALRWAEHPDHFLISIDDARYPSLLRTTVGPPLVLFALGNIQLLNQACLAIVGSRNASALGSQTAHDFAREVASRHVTVVSGLALGIDGAAHRGALTAQQGSTIAVLGTGIDTPYPNSHKRLYELIAQQGCVISEFALGTPGVRYNFPKRNRIIAGLSRALLVVEAARSSGSLITAKLAADFGRDVMAIPGSIHSATSKGCHQLIRDGAALVESVEDIFAACPALLSTQTTANEAPLPDGTPNIEGIEAIATTTKDSEHLNKVGFSPVSVQTLLEQSNESLSVWHQRLSEWEISGQVTRLADGRFVRTLAS